MRRSFPAGTTIAGPIASALIGEDYMLAGAPRTTSSAIATEEVAAEDGALRPATIEDPTRRGNLQQETLAIDRLISDPGTAGFQVACGDQEHKTSEVVGRLVPTERARLFVHAGAPEPT